MNFWKYVVAVFRVGWRIIFDYFAWMIKYSRNPSKYPLELRFYKVQYLIRKILEAFNVIYENKGIDEFYEYKNSRMNTLLICNHLAAVDPLVIVAVAKTPVSFVAKKEVLRMPFVGRIVKILDGEFLERGNIRSEFNTFKNIESKLKNTKNLDYVIFAEGTRNRNLNVELSPFKPGSFKSAYKNNLDICVLSICGSERILSIKYYNKINPIQVDYIKKFDKSFYEGKTTVDLAVISRELSSESYKKARAYDVELMHRYNKKHFN